ncbi:hypothetical protein EJB05_24907, partial [Eragrostis curvula]
FTHGARNVASSIGVTGKELMKPYRSIPSAKDLIAPYRNDCHARGKEDVRRGSFNIVYGDKDARRTTLDVTDGKHDTTGETVGITGCEQSSEAKESWDSAINCYPIDDVPPMDIIPNSSHCDGSIYKGTNSWKRIYRIANRNETRLEAMMLSKPTNCYMDNGICMSHTTRHMLQIFSLKLSKTPVGCGSIELYGYIAVRDNLDPLVNYIVNFSRDHPVIIEQGSLLKMAGPKRGIELVDTLLIEYDMKIKIGEQEKDDLQLIDGVSIIDYMETCNCSAFTCRIHGDCGDIDITAACLNDAVEATVEVLVSEVRGSFNMLLDCFSSGSDEELWLFDGAICEPCGLNRSVVAVVFDAQVDLKFKLSTNSSGLAEYCCSFNSNMHGHDTQEIKTDLGSILVNVTWSTLPAGLKGYI